jgi:hypothetical protein
VSRTSKQSFKRTRQRGLGRFKDTQSAWKDMIPENRTNRVPRSKDDGSRKSKWDSIGCTATPQVTSPNMSSSMDAFKVYADYPICATCGAQYSSTSPPADCKICRDPRQFVPASGQAWTSIRALSDQGTQTELLETHDPRIWRISNDPSVGIGQTRNAYATESPLPLRQAELVRVT